MMRSNIEDRLDAVEQHPDVDTAELEYDDGEVVIMALAGTVDDQFHRFLDQHDMDIRSGPKWVGMGLEVILA